MREKEDKVRNLRLSYLIESQALSSVSMFLIQVQPFLFGDPRMFIFYYLHEFLLSWDLVFTCGRTKPKDRPKDQEPILHKQLLTVTPGKRRKR